MSASMTDYRRQLVLASLVRLGATDAESAQTSAAVADAMIGLSQAEGHPTACWRGITPAHAAGHLRQLETEGMLTRGAGRPNSRAGRSDPSWWAAVLPGTSGAPIPSPPEADPAPDFALTPPEPAAATPYDDMTREQMALLLAVQDETMEVVGKFFAELREVTSRSRVLLSKAGLL